MKKLFSIIASAQNHYRFKLDFPKVDQPNGHWRSSIKRVSMNQLPAVLVSIDVSN